MLVNRVVFTVLLLLAVGALIGTSYAFAWGWGWHLRLLGVALTILFWGGWTASARALMRFDMQKHGGGPLSPPDAAMLRHHSLQGVVAVVFVLSVFVARWIVDGAAAPWHWLGPAFPAIVLICWAVIFVRMLRDADEMQQAAHARAIAVAGGGVVFTASVWGLFEFMLGAPEIPAFLLLPAFSVVYGAAVAIQGGRRL